MDEVWDVVSIARVAGVFALAVILIGAANSALPTIASGDVDLLGEFIKLVVVGMLMVGLLAWVWSWFDAAAPGR